MPWGAAIVGAATVASGYMSSKASSKAADASKDASQAQVAASREAREQQERLNRPYINLGTENIGAYQDILDDPRYNTFETLQKDPYGADYLSNNPLFQASIDNAGRQLGASAAAQGKFNSGGLVDALFQNYMATGDQYYGNYLQRSDSLGASAYNRALMPVEIGQNAANFQGVNSANLITGAGNAVAAGQIGQANAYGQNMQNMANIGGQALGYGINSGLFNGSQSAGQNTGQNIGSLYNTPQNFAAQQPAAVFSGGFFRDY
jgi:hypothetical protein